jgi:hypothetical protein
MSNVLTDILSLFKRRKLVNTVEADDLFVLAKPFTPPEGVLNPRPYMDVRLIKASDLIGVGEVNTASNLGTIPPAIGIFAQKVGTDLQFKSLLAGANITLTEIGVPVESIEISGPAPGETNTMTNIGTGLGNVFSSKVGVQFQLRTIKAGSNITVSTAGDEVVIDGAAPGEVNDGVNVGAGTGTVFFQKTGTDLEFKTLKEGANITINNTAGAGSNEIEISASHGATEDLETTLAAGNFTGANDITMSTQLGDRIIRSDNAVAASQMSLIFLDGGIGQDGCVIGDPLRTTGGYMGLGSAYAKMEYFTAVNAGLIFKAGVSGWNFDTFSGATPQDVTLGTGIGLEMTYAGGSGVLRSVAALTSETWDLPAESGILPVGPAWDTLIANPTVTEDDYTLTWRWNGGVGSQYELRPTAGGTVTSVSASVPITSSGGATPDIALNIKANSGIILDTNDLSMDLSASAIAGTLAIGDGGTGQTTAQLAINALSAVSGASAGEVLTKVGVNAAFAAIPDAKRTWNWGAARNSSSVTNQYIRTFNGTVNNLCPYVVPFACILTDITCSTSVNETWVAEVRSDPRPGGTETVIASISVTSANQDSNTGLSVALSAGDEIAFYCNGNTISYPHIQAWFRET